MASDFKLTKLSGNEVSRYVYLSDTDKIYCLGRYHPRSGFQKSAINQIIYNLKKRPSSKKNNPKAYKYKEQDIIKVAGYFRRAIKRKALNERLTIVPVPPSKIPSDPDYDDRILQICKLMVDGIDSPDVQDLLFSTESHESSSVSANRLTKDEVKEITGIKLPKRYVAREKILLVDDVLTSGAHLIACKEILLQAFPESEVVGLVVGRVDHYLSALEGFSALE